MAPPNNGPYSGYTTTSDSAFCANNNCSTFVTYTNHYYADSTCDPLGEDFKELKRRFWKWLSRFDSLHVDPNPLPILARAVNALRLTRVIQQPCWRAGRWRSVT